MKCLVSGATGFVGRHLCRRLLARGDQVIALSRSGVSLEAGLATQAVDLAREGVSDRLLQDVDAVIHLAGIAHRRAADAEYEALNRRGTLQLAAAAQRAGTGHFVFLSSVKAMGPPGSAAPRTERNCSEPVDSYGLSKWRAECDLREQFADSSMAVSILRPSLVSGAGVKGNLYTLARGVARGLPRPPAGGARSMVAVDDLVDLMCLLVDVPPQRLNTWIAAGEAYTTRQLYDALRAAAGKGTGVAWLPRAGWRLGAALLDLLGGTQDSYEKLFGSEVYDSSAVQLATGWQPRRDLQAVAADIWRGVGQ